MDVRVGLWRRLSAKELMLLKCGVGEDSWESLGLQGDQPWDFFGRNDAKAETPVLWPPHAKSWLIEKTDAGRDWGQEEKGTTEDEMAGRHHWLDGRESEWTPGVGDGQGGLACWNSWGRNESDTTERLNWTELNGFVGSGMSDREHSSRSCTAGVSQLLFCKGSFTGTQPCPFIYMVSMTAFMLPLESWTAETKAIWPIKTNVFTVWLFICWLLV